VNKKKRTDRNVCSTRRNAESPIKDFGNDGFYTGSPINTFEDDKKNKMRRFLRTCAKYALRNDEEGSFPRKRESRILRSSSIFLPHAKCVKINSPYI